MPEARVAIIVAGALGPREHVQRIGRVLRPAPGKHALVYELVTSNTTDARRALARARYAPSRLLDCTRTDDGRIVPRWLGSRDEPWLRELAAEAGASGGRTVREADERIVDAVAPIARRHAASRRTVEAVWAVERRRWSTRVASPVRPEHLRKVVFELAAERSREEALATAGVTFALEPDRIEDLLFADRAHARILDAPETPATTPALLEQYNLALVQSLVARSTELTATVRANVRHVVRYAKLLGLMATFDEAEDGATRMTLSGPLALFHGTVKYGNALARWLPCLMTTPGWALAARVVLGGETLSTDLDAGAPVHVPTPCPAHMTASSRRGSSPILRRLGSRWRIERETAVIRASGRLFFPDFALVSGGDRVLVEIAGYWTTEYLASKAAMIRAARVPLVVCVDQRHANGELAPDAHVLAFEKHVDARALVDACDRLLRAAQDSRPAPA